MCMQGFNLSDSKLEHTKAHAKDPGQIPHREEQHSRASRRFTHFNDKLVEDLTLLDNHYEEVEVTASVSCGLQST